MAEYKHYTERTVESYLAGHFDVSPEADAARFYTVLRSLVGTYGLTDFDIRIERGEQGEKIDGHNWGDGIRFYLTVMSKDRKQARKRADKIRSLLFP